MLERPQKLEDFLKGTPSGRSARRKLLPGPLERSRASSEFWSGDTDIGPGNGQKMDLGHGQGAVLTCPTFGDLVEEINLNS